MRDVFILLFVFLYCPIALVTFLYCLEYAGSRYPFVSAARRWVTAFLVAAFWLPISLIESFQEWLGGRHD